MNPVLNLEALALGYENKRAVYVPRWQIAAGQHAVIVGESGTGKTTLLLAIAAMLKPLSGTLAVAGENISALSASASDFFRRKHIGLVFQDLQLMPELTVLQNLLLAQYAAGQAQNPDALMAMLERAGITSLANQMPTKLSQGQAQRVAVLRALAHKPTLLLCDEPTSSLDNRSCDRMLDLLLDEAAAYGATLIVVTHDLRITSRFPTILELPCAT